MKSQNSSKQAKAFTQRQASKPEAKGTARSQLSNADSKKENQHTSIKARKHPTE